MKKVLITSLSLAAVLAVAVGGCGGGGDERATGESDGGAASTGEAASPLPKNEFVERAKAICTSGQKRGAAEIGQYIGQRKGGGPAQPALLEKAVGAVFVPRVQDQIEEIRELGVPVGDEDRVEAILAAMEQAVDELSEDPTVSTAQFEQSFKPSGKLARAYGLTACVYG